MSTDVQSKPKETVITYVPLGEREEIYLTLDRVRQFLCVPTKSGVMPTNEQIVKFMMLCKAQSLNPWVNDAYLVGYDGRDGAQFSLITAHQSFLKRAEASPEFDGMESGVVVRIGDGELTYREGDLVIKGETLVGGWARVHRRDRKIPSFEALNLETFNTNRSRWLADPAGMIVKVAEASALRKAFPSTLAAMYCREEMDRNHHEQSAAVDTRPKVSRLEDRLLSQDAPASADRVVEPVADVDDVQQSPPDDVPDETPVPEEVAGVLRMIGKAGTATALESVLLRWRAIEAEYSEHADKVSQAISAATQRVIPEGQKKKS